MQGFPGIFCYKLRVKVTDLVSLKIVVENEKEPDGKLENPSVFTSMLLNCIQNIVL